MRQFTENLLLKELNIAFARGDIASLTDLVTADLTWQQAGRAESRGKSDFLAAAGSGSIATLTLEAIISHGKRGAVNGVMTMHDGTTYAFCHVVEFNNAKGSQVKAIMSYLIGSDQ